MSDDLIIGLVSGVFLGAFLTMLAVGWKMHRSYRVELAKVVDRHQVIPAGAWTKLKGLPVDLYIHAGENTTVTTRETQNWVQVPPSEPPAAL